MKALITGITGLVGEATGVERNESLDHGFCGSRNEKAKRAGVRASSTGRDLSVPSFVRSLGETACMDEEPSAG